MKGDVYKQVRDFFECDYESGTLIWKVRPLEMFKRPRDGKAWNTLYAGKRAGTVSHSGDGDPKRQVRVNNRIYRCSRLIWAHAYGCEPDGEIDHIDTNPLNEALSNLRIASRSQNCANRRRQSNNKSGFKGVDFHRNKWRATICINGKNKHLGYFGNPEQAHSAWLEASKTAFGNFVRAR